MEYYNLYKLIKSSTYAKDGIDVDWFIDIDHKEQVIRLLFAQTNSRKDWIINFMFPAKLYKKQKNYFLVAYGWGKAYKSAADTIMKNINKHLQLYPKYRIEVLGYSYGGAIATIAAEDIHYRFYIKPDLITFGCPRVIFGRKSKKYFTSCMNEIKQFAHCNDLVTKVPPFVGYTNLKEIKLGKNFNLKDLFNPYIFHQIYGDAQLYNGIL